MGDTARSELERDLYLRLLELGHCAELEPLLREALSLAIEATKAAGGHIHVFGEMSDEPEWSLSLGCSDEDSAETRKKASRGIEAEVMATGRVVQTPSAFLDPRFADRPSVRGQKLEAVLCAPIGGTTPEGVLYLHGKSMAGPFQEADLSLVETFCRHLGPTVRSLATQQQQQRNSDPTRPLRERLRVDGIVGASDAVANILGFISVAATADIPVLLTGESGTGKTSIAHTIHANSRRSASGIVVVNCPAIPEALFEAELFGAKRGAFTDAHEDRAGMIEAADGGTLFLDEVGELAISNQAKLLQFLQSGTYRRLGESALRRANVRIIAATNLDLEDAVESGSFRRDLYYRLNVFPFRVPALSERRGDIDLVAQHFVEREARKVDRPELRLSPRARMALTTMSWPGNIRDLENALYRAVVVANAEGAHEIDASHLVRDANESKGRLTYQQAMHRCQKEIVSAALESTRWNVVAATDELDITRSHIYKLIKVHGLRRK